MEELVWLFFRILFATFLAVSRLIDNSSESRGGCVVSSSLLMDVVFASGVGFVGGVGRLAYLRCAV